MRAINLIPQEMQRGGGTGLAGRSGGGAFVLVGILVALVIMGIAYGITVHRIANRTNDIAATTSQATALEARAAALQAYVLVQTRRTTRIQLVGTLAAKRFNWALAMDQIAKALPVDAQLSKMTGSLAPGSGGGGGALRSQLPVPAIELTGCSKTQPRVAVAIDSLRRIPGVQVVALGQSVKATATPGSGSSAASTGCGNDAPNFDVVVYYTDPTVAGAPEASAAVPISPNAAVVR